MVGGFLAMLAALAAKENLDPAELPMPVDDPQHPQSQSQEKHHQPQLPVDDPQHPKSQSQEKHHQPQFQEKTKKKLSRRHLPYTNRHYPKLELLVASEEQDKLVALKQTGQRREHPKQISRRPHYPKLRPRYPKLELVLTPTEAPVS
ncbi:MAG: hypothetical protein WCG04_02320 [Alphaproteobacteria bacterium]